MTDGRIIDAMLVVPREQFVAEGQAGFAYMDGDIALSGGRYLMSAMTFARLLQVAEIRTGDKLLIIGSGTGYSAAVASHIAAQVVALESDDELVRHARANLDGQSNISLVQGELAQGHEAKAPYNVIVIEGQVEQVPDKVLRQLADGGRLVAVVKVGLVSFIRIATMKDGVVSWRRGVDGTAPALPQFMVAAPEFVF